MSHRIYGVWGGRPPGGWCLIEFVPGPDKPCWYLGTKETAQVARDQLASERPSIAYDVVLYDPERRPLSREVSPTQAQLVALKRYEEIASRFHRDVYNHWATEVTESTRSAIQDRGWMHAVIDGDGHSTRWIITEAGHRAMKREVA